MAQQKENDALEAELNIPPELKAIIDDPEQDDSISMPLRFTDPDDLMEIFSTLEEQNLFMIEHCQYGEMKLEEKKQEEKEVKAQKQDEVDKTRAKEKQNAEKIRRLMQ